MPPCTQTSLRHQSSLAKNQRLKHQACIWSCRAILPDNDDKNSPSVIPPEIIYDLSGEAISLLLPFWDLL